MTSSDGDEGKAVCAWDVSRFCFKARKPVDISAKLGRQGEIVAHSKEGYPQEAKTWISETRSLFACHHTRYAESIIDLVHIHGVQLLFLKTRGTVPGVIAREHSIDSAAAAAAD